MPKRSDDGRYPYTYADDYVRGLAGYNENGTKLSRSDASQILQSIEKIMKIEEGKLYEALADYYLEHREEITERTTNEALRTIKW